ncbi:hypothetical protein [Cryptosporangium phraense]|uniref:Uncharacterized protein n=1 Tax=Cryptosporangium phraense TaxID=2593070 RepID=A0A545AGX9_9ACTN|nr:hypothetical protein [Cryptosporangium phraense]TQS40573.1 hypothetical protein FL583_34040 [Cryptosporangium phraense]
MDNQVVAAGTGLTVQVRQTAAAQMLRPDTVHVFERYERRVQQALLWMQRKSPHLHIAALGLERSEQPGTLHSEIWPLKPPSKIRGRLRVFCSLDPAGQYAGPEVTSLSHATVRTAEVTQKPTFRGAVDIAGVGPEIEVSPRRSYQATFTATVALDPRVRAEALVAGTPEFNRYLDVYLAEIAADQNLDPATLRAAFRAANPDIEQGLNDPPILVTVEPDVFDVDTPNEPRTIKYSVHARHTFTRTAFVLQLTDLDTGVRSTSDFILVRGGRGGGFGSGGGRGGGGANAQG